MFELRLEKERLVDGVPTIQINIYNNEDASVIKGIIMPFANFAFKAYKLNINEDESYSIIDCTYGTSPHIPFGTYFKSGTDSKTDKELIFGQVSLCILDFIYIHNELSGLKGELAAPSISFRNIEGTELDKFLDDVIKYVEKQ